MSKSGSEKSLLLNCREVMLMSATAGMGLVMAKPRHRNQAMVFDNECRMVDDPEGEVRKLLPG